MGRSPCCEKVGLKKGPWTPEEDQKLLAYIEEHGHGSWRALPAKSGLQRCGKSCRLRWTNYLRPDIKRGKFSLQEEQTIIQLHALLGNRWSAIATHLAKRTDNEIKNYWNTHLKKRLTKMGIDPMTHKPKTDPLGSSSGNPKDTANLSHMAQWESARLEAEARLVRESNLNVVPNNKNINNIRLGSAVHRHFKPSMSSASPLPCLDILKAWQCSWSTKSNPTTTTNNNNTLLSMLAMDDLESPTSTFDFPHVDHNSNNNKFGAVQTLASLDDDNDNDNNAMSFQDIHISALGGHSPHNVTWFDDSIYNNNNNNNVVHGTNAVQNLTDVFVYTSEDQSIVNGESGVFNNIVQQDQNKSYWNSILNHLVNVSTPGSPVF